MNPLKVPFLQTDIGLFYTANRVVEKWMKTH